MVRTANVAQVWLYALFLTPWALVGVSTLLAAVLMVLLLSLYFANVAWKTRRHPDRLLVVIGVGSLAAFIFMTLVQGR